MIETMAKPDLAEHALGARQRVGLLQAPDEERHGDILGGAELGQQVMELVDEAERGVACLRALCFAHLAVCAARLSPLPAPLPPLPPLPIEGGGWGVLWATPRGI